jgi:hypothetical protein
MQLLSPSHSIQRRFASTHVFGLSRLAALLEGSKLLA